VTICSTTSPKSLTWHGGLTAIRGARETLDNIAEPSRVRQQTAARNYSNRLFREDVEAATRRLREKPHLETVEAWSNPSR